MAQIFASTNPFPKFVKRAQNSRKQFEPLRNASVKTLKNDLNKIAKEEQEFLKSLMKQIIPVEITLDKNAKGLHKLVPLNISLIEEDDDLNNAKTEASHFDGTIYDDSNNAIMYD